MRLNRDIPPELAALSCWLHVYYIEFYVRFSDDVSCAIFLCMRNRDFFTVGYGNFLSTYDLDFHFQWIAFCIKTGQFF